jgi:hypothetical protein
MSCTVISDICEGIADRIPICPQVRCTCRVALASEGRAFVGVLTRYLA